MNIYNQLKAKFEPAHILILIAFVLAFVSNKIQEHYFPYKYCSNCFYKSRWGCNDCQNCGFCITPSGQGLCVLGDKSGPYYGKCKVWEHDDPSNYFNWSNWWYGWRNNNYTRRRSWRNRLARQARKNNR
jgi:hypothetical protein